MNFYILYFIIYLKFKMAFSMSKPAFSSFSLLKPPVPGSIPGTGTGLPEVRVLFNTHKFFIKLCISKSASVLLIL